MVCADGSTYEGQFVLGHRHGWGIMTFGSGNRNIFHGMFEHGQRQGPGFVFGEDYSQLYGYYASDELHGCGVFRWPRGAVSDRQYDRGKIVSERHVVDQGGEQWPPSHSKNYESGVAARAVARIQYFGDGAHLVCVTGSWDNFGKQIPLGVDRSKQSHLVFPALPRGRHRFRFIVNGIECVANNHEFPIERDDTLGLDFHILHLE
jgi:hypothetical protein